MGEMLELTTDGMDFMKSLSKMIALTGVVMIAGCLATSMASAYKESEVGEAAVKGTIAFTGTPPAPMRFELTQFPN